MTAVYQCYVISNTTHFLYRAVIIGQWWGRAAPLFKAHPAPFSQEVRVGLVCWIGWTLLVSVHVCW